MSKNQKNAEPDELPAEPVPRLCSEIQLFDLCELDSCRFRQGRFCTEQSLLRRFEEISEDDTSQQRIARDGTDEDEDEENRLSYCDSIEGDDYQDDNDEWDDE